MGRAGTHITSPERETKAKGSHLSVCLPHLLQREQPGEELTEPLPHPTFLESSSPALCRASCLQDRMEQQLDRKRKQKEKVQVLRKA